MNTIAIIQARTGSSRLPGKVMMTLAGRTVLSHVIERAAAIAGVDAVIVATTDDPADDVLVRESQNCGAIVFRGSETDVLRRYFDAASLHAARYIVRITSDCPLLDPELVGRMLALFQSSRADAHACAIDYISNGLERTFPRGLDAEVFTFDALAVAHRTAREPYEREHVTPFLYEHPEHFRIESFKGEPDLSAYRWTLDTPADLALLGVIFRELGRPGHRIRTEEVLALMARRPEIEAINGDVRQKELRA